MPAFDDSESLGRRHAAEIAAYLESVGDAEGARLLRATPAGGQGLSAMLPRWAHTKTGMKVGYVAPGHSGGLLDVRPANTLEPQPRLMGCRLKVTLDNFYCHSFPGILPGRHNIICEFSARNQGAAIEEEAKFALTVAASNGSSASVRNLPIFVGIGVGRDGLSLEGRTVNLGNPADDWLVDALGSDTFRAGLGLLTTAQPALKPFATLATVAVKAAAKRDKNQQVSTFDLGLDFGSNATSIRLCLGTYVIVQGDDRDWSWADVKLEADSLRLQFEDGRVVPNNVLVLGLSETETVAPPPAPPAAARMPAQPTGSRKKLKP